MELWWKKAPLCYFMVHCNCISFIAVILKWHTLCVGSIEEGDKEWKGEKMGMRRNYEERTEWEEEYSGNKGVVREGLMRSVSWIFDEFVSSVRRRCRMINTALRATINRHQMKNMIHAAEMGKLLYVIIDITLSMCVAVWGAPGTRHLPTWTNKLKVFISIKFCLD